MRALVWIIEETWQATVDAAAEFLPSDAEITLLHVAGADSETVAGAARGGLLGRYLPPAPPETALREISEQAVRGLLAEAQARLGRAATVEARHGRVEREIVAATESMDILVLARDGDRTRLGPRSLGPTTRFVVDHAACQILLIWPDRPPPVGTIPPPPNQAGR